MIDINYILNKYPQAKVFEDGFNPLEAKHNGELGKVQVNIQKKKWGGEAWLVYTDKYALKILYVNKGSRLSLQKHNKKQETWHILKGNPEMVLGEEVLVGNIGDVIHIPTGTVHRLSAPTNDVEVLEVSTPELDDLVRIEDDFGRK